MSLRTDELTNPCGAVVNFEFLYRKNRKYDIYYGYTLPSRLTQLLFRLLLAIVATNLINENWRVKKTNNKNHAYVILV